MNDVIPGVGNLTINRFFALDHRSFEAGVPGVTQKKMLGLAASLVLRSDGCVPIVWSTVTKGGSWKERSQNGTAGT